MDYRGVLVLAVAASVLALGSASCSSVDPSTVNFEEKPKQQDIVADGGSSSGASSGGEGGTSEGGADGGGEGGGPVTAFTGASAFDATGSGQANSTKNAGHTFSATMDPSGMACFDCHKTGGTGTAFAIGGSVFDAQTGGKPLLTGAQIRIVDAAGKELFATYSDALGNFEQEPVGATITAGAMVGVRNGTITKLMSTKLSGPSDGNCNQTACHGGATPPAGGPVFLK